MGGRNVGLCRSAHVTAGDCTFHCAARGPVSSEAAESKLVGRVSRTVVEACQIPRRGSRVEVKALGEGSGRQAGDEPHVMEERRRQEERYGQEELVRTEGCQGDKRP